jgi:hypothetical protein
MQAPRVPGMRLVALAASRPQGCTGSEFGTPRQLILHWNGATWK